MSACGGTHVRRTGAIGVIAISGWERFRGGTRLEFKCGGRALRAHRMLRDTVRDSSGLLSIAAGELPQAIERLQGEGKELRRRSRTPTRGWRPSKPRPWQRPPRKPAVCGWSSARWPIATPNVLKLMAQTVAAKPGHVAVLLSQNLALSIVVARSADAPVDAARLLKTLIGRFGGKGGGRPEMAQGGGLDASAESVVAAARALLSSLWRRLSLTPWSP